eukprot:4017122-Amphidinium_carterae.2
MRPNARHAGRDFANDRMAPTAKRPTFANWKTLPRHRLSRVIELLLPTTSIDADSKCGKSTNCPNREEERHSLLCFAPRLWHELLFACNEIN